MLGCDAGPESACFGGAVHMRLFTLRTTARDLARSVAEAAACAERRQQSVLDAVCLELGPRGALVVTPAGQIVDIGTLRK